jgi:DNA mismatch endonuclease, patch repair protein
MRYKGKAPRAANVVRSQNMASIRSKGNKTTEGAFVDILRAEKIKGWRRHMPMLGRPDFVFRRSKLLVFVDGCFWHGCKQCYQAPRHNADYWARKIGGNRSRDAAVSKSHREGQWTVCRIWEHSLRDRRKTTERLRKFLRRRTS